MDTVTVLPTRPDRDPDDTDEAWRDDVDETIARLSDAVGDSLTPFQLASRVSRVHAQRGAHAAPAWIPAMPTTLEQTRYTAHMQIDAARTPQGRYQKALDALLEAGFALGLSGERMRRDLDFGIVAYERSFQE